MTTTPPEAMTDTPAEELRRLHEAATPGPWEAVLRGDPRGQPVPFYRGLIGFFQIEDSPDGKISVVTKQDAATTAERREADAKLVAWLRNNVPLILAALSASAGEKAVEVAEDKMTDVGQVYNRLHKLQFDEGWRPIAEAPKDGTTVFGQDWYSGNRGMVHLNAQGEWEFVDGLTNLPSGNGFYPTHFRPLPPTPLR